MELLIIALGVRKLGLHLLKLLHPFGTQSDSLVVQLLLQSMHFFLLLLQQTGSLDFQLLYSLFVPRGEVMQTRFLIFASQLLYRLRVPHLDQPFQFMPKVISACRPFPEELHLFYQVASLVDFVNILLVGLALL